MGLGVVVAGEADEAAFARLLGGLEGLDGAAGREHLGDVVLVLDPVDLPEVDVVGP